MVMWLSKFVGLLAVHGTQGSDFARLCADGGAFNDTAFPTLTGDQAEFGSVTARDGSTVNYAFTKLQARTTCATMIAPGLSSHAAPFVEWLHPLAQRTACDMISLEYRGFGLSKQAGADKIGMKLAVLASDFDAVVRHAVREYEHVFLLGLSMGANIVWSYLQLYYSPEEVPNVRGIMPMDGGLLATPQSRAAASSFKVGGAFTWDALQEMTNGFLDAAATPETCFNSVFGFFSLRGFFSTTELRDYYLKFMCDFDCASFALLNKDSLFADYTDAVLLNKNRYRIPTFVYQPQGSVLPESIQQFIIEHSEHVPGFHHLLLSEASGGDHFAILPGAPGQKAIFDALVDFMLKQMRGHKEEL